MPPPRRKPAVPYRPSRAEAQRMEDIVHQRSPYESMVLDPDGYQIPQTPMNVDQFAQAMMEARRGSSFRQRMLDPANRRSTNIEDRRGWVVVPDDEPPPNLYEPVPIERRKPARY